MILRSWHRKVFNMLSSQPRIISNIAEGCNISYRQACGSIAHFRAESRKPGSNFILNVSTTSDGITRYRIKRHPPEEGQLPEQYRYLLDLIDPRITFGVELEMAMDKTYAWMYRELRGLGLDSPIEDVHTVCHGNPNKWSMQHDGSIRAWESDEEQDEYPDRCTVEIASPILRGRQGLLQLWKVVSWITKNRDYIFINDSCGTHCHLGSFGDSLDVAKNIIFLYKKNEKLFDTFVSRARRERNNSRYCDTVVGKKMNYIFNQKYIKLSFRKFCSSGTFENRHFHGTLSFEKIVSWILLNQALIHAGTKASFKAKSISQFFKKAWEIRNSQSLNLLISFFEVCEIGN